MLEILEGIRKTVPEDFVVGIRLGAFEPTLEDGIRHAKILEQHGIDFLDISYGFTEEQETEKPAGFPVQRYCLCGGLKQKAGVRSGICRQRHPHAGRCAAVRWS